jgi:hypothetical protein
MRNTRQLYMIDKILSEEKKKLNISLPHKIRPVRNYEMGFGVNVTENQINLTFNESERLNEEEVRAGIRHELCHVLDYREGKIEFSHRGIKHKKATINYPEINELFLQIFAAYTEYLMAKRFIKLYGLDYFKVQNEKGLEEFLNNVIKGGFTPAWLYALFEEAIKTNFYARGDDRFPIGIWKIVDWLCDDFDYIDSLKVKWTIKSDLLAFETITILEDIDLQSILERTEPILIKNEVTFKLYKESLFKKSIFTKNLMEKWSQRLSR